MIGHAVEARHQVVDFRGLMQTQMPLGQSRCLIARHRAAPADTGRDTFFEHFCVSRAGHAIGQHAVKRQVWLIGSQTVGNGAKGLRHAAGIDHRQHGQVKAARDIGGGWRAIKQSHHAFDQNDIRILRGA